MPVQTTTTNLFQLLQQQFGGEISAANEEHKDKPVDVGFQRLPPGIDDGIAKLQVMTLGQYKEGANQGKLFCRCAAVVVHPTEYANRQTSVMFPLCDTPAVGRRAARSFRDNFFDFQNLFKMLGEKPSPETKATDPTGMKAIMYYAALMQKLTDPKRPPVFVSFSTRAYTPQLTPQQIAAGQKPTPRTIENWHGLADMTQLNGQFDPAAGVTTAPPTNTLPPVDVPLPTDTHPDVEGTGEGTEMTTEEEIEYLVGLANDDPAGTTEEGASAMARLQEMALSNGWSEEDVAAADSWSTVGQMALSGPEPEEGSAPAYEVGSTWMFTKRGRDGSKLVKPNGEFFPAQEVEITSVDEKAQTCTVKTTKDGKDVLNVGSKKPLTVKFEWLESK